MAKAPAKPAAKAVPAKKAAAAPAKPAAKAAKPAPEPEPEPELEEEVPGSEPLPETDLVDENLETGDESKDQPEPSMYDYMLDAARAVDSKFQDPMPKESEQAFYKRLLDTIASETDPKHVEGKGDPHLPVWEALTEEQQAWYNAGADSVEKGKPIAALPGYDSRPKPEPVLKGGAVKGGGLQKWREEQARLKAAGELPPAKPRKEKVAKEPRGDGAVAHVQKAVLANLHMTKAEITAYLKQQGHEINDGTISVQYGNARNLMRLAIAAGLTKPDVKIN
jgi:hypothetical protein